MMNAANSSESTACMRTSAGSPDFDGDGGPVNVFVTEISGGLIQAIRSIINPTNSPTSAFRCLSWGGSASGDSSSQGRGQVAGARSASPSKHQTGSPTCERGPAALCRRARN
jgi:hypothetical protein